MSWILREDTWEGKMPWGCSSMRLDAVAIAPQDATDRPSVVGSRSEKLRAAALKGNPREYILTNGKVCTFFDDNPI